MKNMWNEYVNYCNIQEAKRDAARKAAREAHPTFYKIMDVLSTIMMIVGAIIWLYGAICWIEDMINQLRQPIENLQNKISTTVDQICKKDHSDEEDAPVEE